IIHVGIASFLSLSLIPTCMMKIGGETLLERQIAILKKCGIKDIVVVVGKEGNCWNQRNRNLIRKLTKNVIVNPINLETPSSSSLFLALNYFEPSPTIIMDGDTIFEKSIIKTIVNSRHKNLLLVGRGKSDIITTRILMKENKVKGIGRKIKSNDIYTGFMKVDTNLYKVLRNKLKQRKSQFREYTEVVDKNLKKYNVYGKHMESIQANIGEVLDLKPLVGGSFASTKVISKLMKKTAYVVRKEAVEGRAKLIDEIKWIRNLPNDLKPYFPEMIGYDTKSKKAWVEFQYYHLPTLRTLLVDKSLSADTALYLLKIMIDFMFSRIYNKRVSNKTKDYTQKIHLNRIKQRLLMTSQKSKILGKIINSRHIVINGKKFYNIPTIIKLIEEDKSILRKLKPSFTSMVHGDLHFDNFLVDISQMPMVKFILFDPRGIDKKYNYTYDLGKLWHSFNSKYDLIHEGQFKLGYKFNRGDFIADMSFTDKRLFSVYSKIKDEFPKILNSIPEIKKDKNWLMRTKFSEMSHLCSVMPFHIKYDEKERLAIALYLVGVKLANDFVFEYCRDIAKSEAFSTLYANINTIQDYIKAKKLFE
ncbi:MAG: NTP transferase domain-containing protein, partial [Nanoarchaeota archaeon]|nr:NTP transferase domain-containing protein [Nanoarchaeota archaeon]